MFTLISAIVAVVLYVVINHDNDNVATAEMTVANKPEKDLSGEVALKLMRKDAHRIWNAYQKGILDESSNEFAAMIRFHQAYRTCRTARVIAHCVAH